MNQARCNNDLFDL